MSSENMKESSASSEATLAETTTENSRQHQATTASSDRRSVAVIHNPYQTVTSHSRKRARSDEQAKPDRTNAAGTVNDVAMTTTSSTYTSSSSSSSSTNATGTSVSDQVSALVIAAADKAGMQGIDRARIDAIILRESAQTLYMQQQQRRDEKVNARIAQMKAKLLHAENNNAAATAADSAQNKNSSTAKIRQRLEQEEQEVIRRRRPMRSTCVVVDMDMFYMAVELLSRPDLQERPACVGGNMILTSNYKARKYGVRSAMAGWIGDALVRELSDGKERLIHVPANFDLYQAKSRIVREVLQEYDPISMRAYSLDEVYLNLGPYLAQKLLHPDWNHERVRDYLLMMITRRNRDRQQAQNDKDRQDKVVVASIDADISVKGSEDMQLKSGNDNNYNGSIDNSSSSFYQDPSSVPSYRAHSDNYDAILTGFPAALCLEQAGSIVLDMRRRVFDRTGGLTCSAGLAPTFKLAKIASDHNKPNGQCLVANDHESVLRFLHPLPTRKVPGIGRVTEKILKAFGIESVRQLYEQRVLVQQIFTPIQARGLWLASIGCSSSDGKDEDEEDEENNDEGITQKGISRERTFRPGKSWTEINSKLEDVARILSNDMQQKNLLARTITVKVKLHTFDALSKARSLDRPTLQSPDDLVSHAAQLLAEIRSEFLSRSKKKKNLPPTSVFSIRLLGIRCSNFQNEISSMDHEETGNQMNIDSFLKYQQDEDNQKKKATSPPPSRNVFRRQKSQMQMDLFLQLPGTQSDVCAGRQDQTALAAERTPKEATKPEVKRNASEIQCNYESPMSLCIDSAPTATALETDIVSCPICGKNFPQNANAALNHHIDSCLSGDLVREAVREESIEQQMVSNDRKRRLTDFFSVS